jgi:hypothetical protein
MRRIVLLLFIIAIALAIFVPAQAHDKEKRKVTKAHRQQNSQQHSSYVVWLKLNRDGYYSFNTNDVEGPIFVKALITATDSRRPIEVGFLENVTNAYFRTHWTSWDAFGRLYGYGFHVHPMYPGAINSIMVTCMMP